MTEMEFNNCNYLLNEEEYVERKDLIQYADELIKIYKDEILFFPRNIHLGYSKVKQYPALDGTLRFNFTLKDSKYNYGTNADAIINFIIYKKDGNIKFKIEKIEYSQKQKFKLNHDILIILKNPIGRIYWTDKTLDKFKEKLATCYHILKSDSKVDAQMYINNCEINKTLDNI